MSLLELGTDHACLTGDCECGSHCECVRMLHGYIKDICKEARNLNDYAKACHEANKKWWQDPATGEPIERDKLNLLFLVISEVAEAGEGVRKDCMDDHLPHRKMEEVELADTLIRIFDYAGGFGLDLQGAFEEKMAYNRNRADHKHENRVKEGGKKF